MVGGGSGLLERTGMKILQLNLIGLTKKYL